MGYRYTFIADDIPREYPDWFKDKWKDVVDFEPLHSKVEGKNWILLFEDLQKLLKEQDSDEWDSFYIAELGEMGMVYRYKITKDEIKSENLAYDW